MIWLVCIPVRAAYGQWCLFRIVGSCFITLECSMDNCWPWLTINKRWLIMMKHGWPWSTMIRYCLAILTTGTKGPAADIDHQQLRCGQARHRLSLEFEEGFLPAPRLSSTSAVDEVIRCLPKDSSFTSSAWCLSTWSHGAFQLVHSYKLNRDAVNVETWELPFMWKTYGKWNTIILSALFHHGEKWVTLPCFHSGDGRAFSSFLYPSLAPSRIIYIP